MYLIVSLQISNCDVCQWINKKLTTGLPELNPIPVKSPWHHIGIDFIWPVLPPASDGSLFILTVCDYFTKWVEAIPTLDKSTPTAAKHLCFYLQELIVMHWGTSKYL